MSDTEKNSGDDTVSIASGGSTKSKKDANKESDEMVSLSEFLSFFPTFKIKVIFALGIFAAFLNGLTFPLLAYAFSSTMSDLGGPTVDMEKISNIAYIFMGIGSAAFVAAFFQNLCFTVSADRASRNFRLSWFEALLRQDAAYFDTHEIGGIASSISANTQKVQRGLGIKLGEGVQFGTAAVGGIVYAFVSSWKVTFLLLAILPVVALTGVIVMKINQSKTARAAKSYKTASGIVYSTVSSIRTVLSLNSVNEMIRLYVDATQEAYDSGVSVLFKEGLANGSMLGSFMCMYAVLTVFGSYLIYSNVRSNGCDASGAVDSVDECTSSGPKVFGALMGAAFAGQGASQLGNVLELVAAGRVAMFPGLKVIKRVVEKPTEEEDNLNGTSSNKENEQSVEKKFDTEETDMEGGNKKEKFILPPYRIDPSSTEGLKPENIKGEIAFENVQFAYPTRPNSNIFKNLNLEIKAGTTVAIVGPSGSGKSTTVSLIERFYDPIFGKVTLDGIDLTKINVTHLRSMIGYVGQEPTLFATSIAGNIRYGKPDATQEEIEEAARKANAHEFIMSFPDKYDTQVGDKGSQLSGGQKQRIAIARVLVSNPKVLLLDEATSALDSESELVVQDALDKMLVESKRTTVIIAHRLSTIRNADVIAVVSGGEVVEQGTHDELIELPTGHYRNLIEKQESAMNSSTHSSSLKKNLDSYNDLQIVDGIETKLASNFLSSKIIEFNNVTFSYPTRPNKLIMNGFDLAINRGETLALVGPSGGGKSTVISLIERFYDPNEGVVSFEGNDLKALNVSSLRDQLGLVAQEPTLFNMSIAENIRLAWPEATEEDINQAAKMANAYDFIMEFAHGFDTQVGERGLQLSGGQKQRVAIARAIVKKPKVLLLDEATSALDSESEQVVQEALDNIMASAETTTIVIAHRLSTIRNADRIAFISKGKVTEIGTHDELMQKVNGRFQRLVNAQNRTMIDIDAFKDTSAKENKESEDKDIKTTDTQDDEDTKKFFDKKFARTLAIPDLQYIFIGVIGCLVAGFVFPAWGIMFAQMIKVLFAPTFPCDDNGAIPFNHSSCQAYYDSAADSLRTKSFELGGWWGLLVFGCMFGNLVGIWGMGVANERLNKRIRNMAYKSLVRQEVSFFDKRSVGSISSQLQDDVTEIQAFAGKPVSELAVALSSILGGLIVAFVSMWPFALVALGTVPIMGIATSLEMKRFLGNDLGDDSQDGLESPGGIVVETLLNIRTVAALTLEKTRHKNYIDAIETHEPKNNIASLKTGVEGGLAVLIQQWSNALLFFWGGYLMYKYPDTYDFEKFLTSMFSLLFSLFGLGAAFQGVKDKDKAMESAGRIFFLMKRESAIDPLSNEGKKL